MINAALVSPSSEADWRRMFPHYVPEWGGVRFSFSPTAALYDILFVYDGLPDALIYPDAPYRVFVASEPQAIKTYRQQFLAQFDLVLTTDVNTRHRNFRITQVGPPWHVGIRDNQGQMRPQGMGWLELETFRPVKTKQVSVVSSNKAYAEGHRERLQFVERIKAHFGPAVDVFGRGINGFADKLDVLSEYRYHIAIENSTFDHYWTEKLSDPLLTLTYPLYHGSGNILEYFPPEALTPIDIRDPENAIGAIRRIIESDTAERAVPHMEEARRRILNEHNLMAILSEIAREVVTHRCTSRVVKPRLLPEKVFKPRGEKFRSSVRKRLRTIADLMRR
ncbi:glycosyltransferase family 10 [Neorhizobium galegae]|uniref:glycosyltransferase family 10 domain-containing protein n=1 Tax=Neorhizobium galegae TaxID=399 RepID=UPI0021009314|nr:glycosyltransferase family 10 [Neorhizobium galegae]MCQ1575186.1 glycosyltransferase family 10 [Neorhizobium galegae]